MDAAGRAIDSPPVVKDVEPFKPKVKRRDLDFGAPVGAGETAKNDSIDLIGAKRGLSNTKLFSFDVTKERSDEAGKRFTDAVKAFQTNRGLKTDGLMNPEGPTVKALRSLLFPPGTASNVGQPVDLSRGAARPLATPVAAPLAGGQPKADAPPAALGNAPSQAESSGNRADGDRPAVRQATDTEIAEMKIERPIPPQSRREFATRFKRVSGASAKVLEKMKEFPNTKSGIDKMNAEADILRFLGSLAEDIEGVAKIIDSGDLSRSADSLRNEVVKGEKGRSRGETADMLELSRRLNGALGLFIALLGSRDA